MTQQLDEQEWVWREIALAEEEQELDSHTVCVCPIPQSSHGSWTRKGLTDGSVLWSWCGRESRKTFKHTLRVAVCVRYVCAQCIC